MITTIQEIANLTRPILKKYGIRYAGLFGSRARGDARPDSDVDILVSLGDGDFSLWDLVGIKDELSTKLGKPVDLLSDQAIVPYFRDFIYRDLKTIYEEK